MVSMSHWHKPLLPLQLLLPLLLLLLLQELAPHVHI
jgi:hypothetical protein